MTAIVAVRYLPSSGAVRLADRAGVRPGLYAGLGPQIRREIGWSLASAAIYGVPAGDRRLGLAGARLDADLHRRGGAIRCGTCRSRCCSTSLAHDTWFYWTHRCCTARRWFRAAHAVHHASRPPTAWAAMSFHPLEALTGAVVIPALVFVVPIHAAVLGAGAGDHDGDGRHQPHGLGDVSARARSFAAWAAG